jgi:hypothetical protein
MQKQQQQQQHHHHNNQSHSQRPLLDYKNRAGKPVDRRRPSPKKQRAAKPFAALCSSVCAWVCFVTDEGWGQTNCPNWGDKYDRRCTDVGVAFSACKQRWLESK